MASQYTLCDKHTRAYPSYIGSTFRKENVKQMGSGTLESGSLASPKTPAGQGRAPYLEIELHMRQCLFLKSCARACASNATRRRGHYSLNLQTLEHGHFKKPLRWSMSDPCQQMAQAWPKFGQHLVNIWSTLGQHLLCSC